MGKISCGSLIFKNVSSANSYSSQFIQISSNEGSKNLLSNFCVMFIFLSNLELQEHDLTEQPSQHLAQVYHALSSINNHVIQDTVDVHFPQTQIVSQSSQVVPHELLENNNVLPSIQDREEQWPPYFAIDYTHPFPHYDYDHYHTVDSIDHPLLRPNPNVQNTPMPSEEPQASRKWGSTGHHSDATKKQIKVSKLAIQKDRDPVEVCFNFSLLLIYIYVIVFIFLLKIFFHCI
jgi:hypothetical protein